MQLEEVLIPISVFATIFGILYIYFTTRHKERLALIEKGTDASLFHTGKRNNKMQSLKFGMFLVGIAMGLLFGNIIAETTRLEKEIAYFSMTFLCGGLSLIFFYLLEKKMDKE